VREREGEREREREIERYKEGVKKERIREKEREERELAWVPCALVSGYTSYGSEGRYSSKFRVMQQQDLSSFLVASLCPLILSLSHHPVSSPFLYKERPSFLLSLSFPHDSRSPVGTVRFVSFFVSEDKPIICLRRSRHPTAYTRTRQLLRTTRHIVSNSSLPLITIFLLSRSSKRTTMYYA